MENLWSEWLGIWLPMFLYSLIIMLSIYFGYLILKRRKQRKLTPKTSEKKKSPKRHLLAIQNKYLILVGVFSLLILVYNLCVIVPSLIEYSKVAHLFEQPSEGYHWKDFVLEARKAFWKGLIGLILQTGFFGSMAVYSFTNSIKFEEMTE